MVLISISNTAVLSSTTPLSLSGNVPFLKANVIDKGFTFRPNYKIFEQSYVADVRMSQFPLLNTTGPLLPSDGGFRTPGVSGVTQWVTRGALQGGALVGEGGEWCNETMGKGLGSRFQNLGGAADGARKGLSVPLGICRSL
jgi:hypothetical protein